MRQDTVGIVFRPTTRISPQHPKVTIKDHIFGKVTTLFIVTLLPVFRCSVERGVDTTSLTAETTR